MTNPFDDADGEYLVLVNDEGQHSLWPASLGVPAGWRITRPADSRANSLAHIERTWTDLRPRSLVEQSDAVG